MKLTPEQAAAVNADAPRIAVVAGAGTGKTRVLTARYLLLVTERGVLPSRVLALTFTEKAAREMKERIRAGLQERGRRDLARDAEFAPISTVHAFLGRTLRERALDAGLDPRFAIADEMTAELLLEEALAATLAEMTPEDYAALVDVSGGEDWLLSLYGAARATPYAMEELLPATLDEEALRIALERFLDAAEGEKAAGKTGERLDTLRRLRGSILDLDASVSQEFREAVKGTVARAQMELFREGRELATAYATLEHRAAAEASGAAIQRLLVALDTEFTRRKREEGLLDFSDLEREGLALLRSHAGPAIAAEYDHLLIDEYQDTSRIQAAILACLAGEKMRGAFGVGDSKQSIYRFRHADASVFGAFRESAVAFPLSGSFRTRREIVEFTNGLFRKLFAGRDVEPQDLHAAAEWRDRPTPSVELLSPEGKNATDARRLEARALARRLRDLIEVEKPPRTRGDRGSEPLRYGDCALLLRATTHLSTYERALADAGVPYVVVKGRGYYAAREVVDLAHLLTLLGDPWDRYRAVAVLTSLFCGVPDGDLAQLPHEACMPLHALDGERPAAIPEDRWARLRLFAERFTRWRDLAGRVPAGDLVERILAETRVHDLLLLERDGRRRHANLQKALRRARASDLEAHAFARSLLEFRERERRESEAPIAAESDDALRIMTVHGSKGLEFPVLAVADLTAGRRGGGSGPILDAKGTFGFKLRGEDESIEPPGFAALHAWNKEQEENEALRLLYVAFTRAEEHLILSGARYKRASSFPGDLFDSPPPELTVIDAAPLASHRREKSRFPAVRAAIRRGAPLPPDLPRDERGAEQLLKRLDSSTKPPLDSTPYVAAAADLIEFERCPRRYRLRRMLGIDLEAAPPEEPEPFPQEMARRTVGTAFHELMKERGQGGVPEASEILAVLPGAPPEEVERMRGWCAWLDQQEVTRRLRGQKQHREMPFLVRLSGLAVRGVLDLYAPTLPLLIDYKTSRKAEPAEYTTQMAIYMEAIAALGFPAAKSALLIYVDAEEIIEVPAESVAPLIDRFQRAHLGQFEPAPGPPCRHCDFRSTCLADGVAVPA